MIGTDDAGSFIWKIKIKKDIKVYLLLFIYSLCRSNLEILPNQKTNEFLQVLKRLITRTGHPKVIYSDNSRTIVGVAKFIPKIMKSFKVTLIKIRLFGNPT